MTTLRPIKDAGRRPDIEADLREKYHVDFTYLTGVLTSAFDIDRSLHNQARFEPLNEETAETYREGVERGDAFPAVIAYRPGRGANPKLVIIDGNHRLVAHDRAKAPIDVYEVARDTRPQVIALMTYAFNTRHGRPTTEDERVVQAIYLIDNGAALPDAAAAVNVPVGAVRKALARKKADERAKEVGVDMREWDGIAGASRQRLLNISTDEGFHDAVHLAFAAKLTADEVFELVAMLNGSKSGTKQRQLVRHQTEAHTERIQANAGGVLGTSAKRAMGPRGRLALVLGQVAALPDDMTGLAAAYAEGEREEGARKVLSAAERLTKLARTIDPSLS